MSDLVVLGVRGLAGGSLVVVFAVIGEIVRPKSFSGLFSAAPSVALASLAVTVVAKGSADAHASALGMIAGSAAMVAYCVAAMLLLPRLPAVAGAGAPWAVWLAVAILLAVLVL